MNPVLERTRASIEDAIGRASEETMRRAPAGKWPAAAIVEHLALSYEGTVRSMRAALRHEHPIGHRPTMGQRIAQIIVIDVGYLPRREAPTATVPSGLPPSAALRAWREGLSEMDEAIAACERAYGAQALVADHPILGGLTTGGWRRFHLQHARHHVRQIRRRLAG